MKNGFLVGLFCFLAVFCLTSSCLAEETIYYFPEAALSDVNEIVIRTNGFKGEGESRERKVRDLSADEYQEVNTIDGVRAFIIQPTVEEDEDGFAFNNTAFSIEIVDGGRVWAYKALSQSQEAIFLYSVDFDGFQFADQLERTSSVSARSGDNTSSSYTFDYDGGSLFPDNSLWFLSPASSQVTFNFHSDDGQSVAGAFATLPDQQLGSSESIYLDLNYNGKPEYDLVTLTKVAQIGEEAIINPAEGKNQEIDFVSFFSDFEKVWNEKYPEDFMFFDNELEGEDFFVEGFIHDSGIVNRLGYFGRVSDTEWNKVNSCYLNSEIRYDMVPEGKEESFRELLTEATLDSLKIFYPDMPASSVDALEPELRSLIEDVGESQTSFSQTTPLSFEDSTIWVYFFDEYGRATLCADILYR